jgi:ParB-like chromosome segregation protein Spo0J
MKTPVEEFEAILLATFELAASMEKTNMSTLKLLEELTRNPNPVDIDAFLRMAETIRRAWSVLLRKGKAPTRKARDGVEKQQLLASARKKTLRVHKNRRKN